MAEYMFPNVAYRATVYRTGSNMEYFGLNQLLEDEIPSYNRM
jgi:hypothetical protein